MIKLAIAKIVHRTVLGLPWIPNKYVNTHCTYQETLHLLALPRQFSIGEIGCYLWSSFLPGVCI